MTTKWNVEYTDTFGGQPNYSWVGRETVEMPEETQHFGSDGVRTYINRSFERELMRRAKAVFGLTGVRGRTQWFGDYAEFRPYKSCTILFVTLEDN